MSDAFQIMGRDQEIVHALALHLRLMSQRQIAGHWWAGELTNARRRLKRLLEKELLSRVVVQSRPIPLLETPLVTWRPGNPDPSFGRIAYCCRQRWRQRPVRPCTVWIATPKAARIFGGVQRDGLQHALQATHDLGVAAVWLRLREVAPDWAEAWRSEDLLAHTRRGEKLPDAFIVNASEEVVWVIEFGGDYDAKRISEFHEDCRSRGLSYQLW